MEQPDYQQLIDKRSYQKYEEILSRKDEVFNNIVRQNKPNIFNQIVRISLRVAAVLVPFVVVTVIIATNLTDRSINFWQNNKKENKTEVGVEKKCNVVITFHDANLEEILNKLVDYYPEIKGIKGHLSDDSILVTTEFTGQTLDEVIEELNIHFGEKIRFDGDYVLVSD